MKLKRFIIFPLLLLSVLQVMADEVTVADIETTPGGSTELVINFTTTATNITGYQMSLYLPDGVALQKDEDDEYIYTLSSRHNKSHTFSVNEQADGGLMLVCYSLTKKTIATGSGELLRLPVSVASDAIGTLTAEFKNIKVSDTSSNVTRLADVTMHIESYEPLVNKISVGNINATAGGSAELVIDFATPETNITGYQMSLYLPNGVTLQKDEDDDYVYTLSARHNKNHSFSVNEQADGGLMLVCYSLTKKTIASGRGELLRLPVNVAANATGTLTAYLRTVKISDTSSNVTQLDDVTFNIICTGGGVVEKKEQTLSLTSLPELTVGDAAYQLPTKTAEGLALTWSSSNTTVATISSNKLTAVAAGTAVITAKQAGNSSYLPFEWKFTLTVKSKPVGPDTPEPQDEDTDISKLDNAVYIEAAEGLVGTTIDLNVKLKNQLSPVGCSFLLTLPEGFTLAKDEDGDLIYTIGNRARKFSLTMKDWNTGTYDFALTPSTNTATISGSEGEVITFKLQIPEETTPGEFKLRLKNCLIQTKVDGTTVDNALSDVVTTLTVEDYIPGDVNGDGKVTPSDAIMILYHYFQVEQNGFNVKAADLNGDNKISPADAIEALYLYFESGQGKAPQRDFEMSEPQ